MSDSTDRRKYSIVNAESRAFSKASAFPSQSVTDFQVLDEKGKSMMEKGQKMIPGPNKQETSYNCKVCGKEGFFTSIKNHIEANHLEGISLPCDFCDKTCPSRAALKMHKYKSHK